jgi:hypothetical protein
MLPIHATHSSSSVSRHSTSRYGVESFASSWRRRSSSGGMQFYFYLANVSVPLLGTILVQTPELSGYARSFISFSS